MIHREIAAFELETPVYEYAQAVAQKTNCLRRHHTGMSILAQSAKGFTTVTFANF